MSFFDKLKTYQARATQTAQEDGTQNRPVLLSPENVPTTMSVFPLDFPLYIYNGPAIERIPSFTKGEASYRRGLVAQMVCTKQSSPDPEGNAPTSSIDMTASVRDLIKANHPQAHVIAQALGEYYKTKVYGTEKEPVKSTPHPTPSAKRDLSTLFSPLC